MNPLGTQTVTVIERVRGRHNEYRDGTRTIWSGCSVQPLGQATESINREERSIQQFRLFAPAGFRAEAADEVEVDPDPLAGGDGPTRLQLVGPAQPWPDAAGQEDHVEAVLRLRTG